MANNPKPQLSMEEMTQLVREEHLTELEIYAQEQRRIAEQRGYRTIHSLALIVLGLIKRDRKTKERASFEKLLLSFAEMDAARLAEALEEAIRNDNMKPNLFTGWRTSSVLWKRKAEAALEGHYTHLKNNAKIEKENLEKE